MLRRLSDPCPFLFYSELGLWDKDYNADDQVGENVCFDLNDMPLGETIEKTFTFREVEVVGGDFGFIKIRSNFRYLGLFPKS